jgi:hypothetical protein
MPQAATVATANKSPAGSGSGPGSAMHIADTWTPGPYIHPCRPNIPGLTPELGDEAVNGPQTLAAYFCGPKRKPRR